LCKQFSFWHCWNYFFYFFSGHLIHLFLWDCRNLFAMMEIQRKFYSMQLNYSSRNPPPKKNSTVIWVTLLNIKIWQTIF
jgi:DNA-directed RNA polymerase